MHRTLQRKHILFGLYASRVAMVLIYIFSPKTDLNFYIFAAALGFTWLATVAPTAAVTGKLFGTRYLATLFGLVMLTHQIGGFLGSYIGGIVITQFGDYGWMWYADAVLADTAALLVLPVREPRTAA
ncbi:putative transmembrane transport protein [Neisseria gonorrhoeae]|uniref:Putative transmembrane transport protein n=1 Tax=Neisseria gonorrhoeae TaxID=485 RepID=A0A379B113_NEIGO|nr:putative transmembrane transport protein [Neisseria gonorrhoeae]